MSDYVKCRSELLFIYDIKDSNPNGDPLDDNKPRIDEETGTNIVTDVRLKRTIRDFLFDFKNQEIFVREARKDDGSLKTKEDRLSDLKIDSVDSIIQKCIDIRLFGATAAIKDKSIILTGPVQFKFGRSLHRVNISFVKGTTVMPSKESKKQGTFTECYQLPYSLICFYGIVNENAAKTTKLTENDVRLLLDAMWNGTKNLISRSKAGQVPRLLLKVNYNENDYHIGDLNSMIKLTSQIVDEEIRDISQTKLDISELLDVLGKNQEYIKCVEYCIDDRLKLIYKDKETTFADCLNDVKILGIELKL